MEIYIFAILLVLLYYAYNNPRRSKRPIYFDIHMEDLCKTAGEGPGALPQNGDYGPTAGEKPTVLEARARAQPQPLKDNEPNSLDFLYHNDDDYPFHGDDKLTFKMLDAGRKNKKAMTSRALWDKNSFIPYIEEELQDHSESIWWEDETLEAEF